MAGSPDSISLLKSLSSFPAPDHGQKTLPHNSHLSIVSLLIFPNLVTTIILTLIRSFRHHLPHNDPLPSSPISPHSLTPSLHYIIIIPLIISHRPSPTFPTIFLTSTGPPPSFPSSSHSDAQQQTSISISIPGFHLIRAQETHLTITHHLSSPSFPPAQNHHLLQSVLHPNIQSPT